MNKEFLWKTIILVVGLVVIVGLFIGFRVFDHQLAQIESLQETILQQENQIELLEASNQRLDVEYQEDEFQRIVEVVSTFVNAIYDIRQDNYDLRLGEAEQVMTPSMLERYFPEMEQEVELEMEYRIRDFHIYPSTNLQSSIIVMEGSTVNLNNGERENNRITLEVSLQKEGETWLVEGFQQLYAESL